MFLTNKDARMDCNFYLFLILDIHFSSHLFLIFVLFITGELSQYLDAFKRERNG